MRAGQSRSVRASTVVVLLLLASQALPTGLAAQRPLSEHTLALDRSAPPTTATVDDLAWLAGHWRGPGLGGVSEELWAPPLGGQLMGAFRLVVNDATQLFEIFTVLELEGRLVLRLKHFDANLRSWEDPDEYVDFPLVRVEGRRAYFHGLTYDATDPDVLRIWLVLSQDGVSREEAFVLGRVRPN